MYPFWERGREVKRAMVRIASLLGLAACSEASRPFCGVLFVRNLLSSSLILVLGLPALSKFEKLCCTLVCVREVEVEVEVRSWRFPLCVVHKCVH